MHEQRLTLRLRNYWDSLRKSDTLPTLQHFHSSAVDELWPYCMRVVVVKSEERIFRYDYMGTELLALYGTNLSGQTISERTPQFAGMIIYRKLIEAMQSKQPLINEGQFVTPKSQMMRYRAIFLPFGNKDGGVTHIIIGLTFRQY